MFVSIPGPRRTKTSVVVDDPAHVRSHYRLNRLEAAIAPRHSFLFFKGEVARSEPVFDVVPVCGLRKEVARTLPRGLPDFKPSADI
jgi:hypothetical protein